ncbi:MAG: hypothetical protein ACHQ8D_06275 [Candidatus Rokuibacteriota bacterium]
MRPWYAKTRCLSRSETAPVWVIPATALVARAEGPQVLSVREDRSVH